MVRGVKNKESNQSEKYKTPCAHVVKLLHLLSNENRSLRLLDLKIIAGTGALAGDISSHFPRRPFFLTKAMQALNFADI